MEKLIGGSGVALYIFFLLLPGLLGAMAYDYFREGEKREYSERIETALVLSLFSHVVMQYFYGIDILPNLDISSDTHVDRIVNAFIAKNLLYKSIISAGAAFVFAIVNNFDLIYKALTSLKLSNKRSKFDVWRDVFGKNKRIWISVRFTDGRQLVGWPEFYSPPGKPREIFVADAIWYRFDENSERVSDEVDGPGVYLSNFDDVVAIEFLN